MTRKIIQITVDNSTSNSGYDSADYIGSNLLALCNDGTIWEFNFKNQQWDLWVAVPIPQPYVPCWTPDCDGSADQTIGYTTDDGKTAYRNFCQSCFEQAIKNESSDT